VKARTEIVLAAAVVYAVSVGLWYLLLAVGGWISCVILALVATGGAIAFFSWIITGNPIPGGDET
jgi:ABC-type maltose transport system permease subunit